MSNFVRYHGHVYPRSHFEADSPKPGQCAWCGGLGIRAETIDGEQLDVAVPCFACQEYCQTCKKYQKKGHECPR